MEVASYPRKVRFWSKQSQWVWNQTFSHNSLFHFWMHGLEAIHCFPLFEIVYNHCSHMYYACKNLNLRSLFVLCIVIMINNIHVGGKKKQSNWWSKWCIICMINGPSLYLYRVKDNELERYKNELRNLLDMKWVFVGQFAIICMAACVDTPLESCIEWW